MLAQGKPPQGLPKRMDKKSEKIEIRMTPDEKSAFLAACKKADISASDYLRAEIDRFIVGAQGAPASPQTNQAAVRKGLYVFCISLAAFIVGSLFLMASVGPDRQPRLVQDYEVYLPTTPAGVSWEDVFATASATFANAAFGLTQDRAGLGPVIEFCENGVFAYRNGDTDALFRGYFHKGSEAGRDPMRGEWRLLREFERVSLELTAGPEKRVTFFVGQISDAAIDLEGLRLFRIDAVSVC